MPLLAGWLALGGVLGVPTKMKSAARCAALAAVTIKRESPFNAPSQPFKYAAELSSVLSIPASAQRKALPHFGYKLLARVVGGAKRGKPAACYTRTVKARLVSGRVRQFVESYRVVRLPSGGFEKRFPLQRQKAHGWAHGTRTSKGRNEVENLKRSETERKVARTGWRATMEAKGSWRKDFGESASGRRSLR